MQKINILFDASILYDAQNSANTSGRSGVYWVAYNFLKKFSQCSVYHVFLYNRNLQTTRHDKFLASFPHIKLYDNNFLHNNISTHKSRLKESKNIREIFILNLKIIKNLLRLLAWNFRSLFTTKEIAAFFSPFNALPEKISKNPSIKKFHILYDCILALKDMPFFKQPDENFQNIINKLNKQTWYFCISECTKKDFLSIASEKLEPNKMMVTPIASSQSFIPRYDKTLLHKALQKYNLSISDKENFIFSLCNIDPRKNLIFTVRCFIKFIEKHNIETMYFLLGGGHFLNYIKLFTQEISSFNRYQNKIKFLGYVDDDDVNVLYSNSLFFTYLSQYEGFGMPPLEAMQAGTPVICSNNSSLPEVVGDAAITITCNDEDACIRAFEDLYFNKNLREEYIAKGLERAKLFSWEKTFKLMSDKIISVVTENNATN